MDFDYEFSFEDADERIFFVIDFDERIFFIEFNDFFSLILTKGFPFH